MLYPARQVLGERVGTLIIASHEKMLKGNWDVLFVLDACRHDMFNLVHKESGMAGTLIPVNSGAIETDLWYEKHWSEYQEDIILITPHARIFKNGHCKNFYASVDTSDIKNQDDWRSPEMAVKVFREAQKENADKRFIVHLIPPHLPFLGEHGRKWLESIRLLIHPDYKRIAGLCNNGRDLTWSKVKEFYIENIKFAIGFIKNIPSEIAGKIVITGDHGELLGENGLYGHGYKIDSLLETLTTVPWFEFNNEKNTVDS